MEISDKASAIKESDAFILPGVGAFQAALRNLAPTKDLLIDEVKAGKPVLGICLGLQLLFTRSYEGGVFDGLDLMKGEVLKLPDDVKQPHIGWNQFRIVKQDSMLDGVPERAYAYFVHSYYPRPGSSDDALAYTNYGVEFPSVFRRRNIFATQFHPEKSGPVGRRILTNFVELVRR